MTAHVDRVILDAADPGALGRFYSVLLDRQVTAHADDVACVSLCRSVDLALTASSASKSGKNRLHFDLTSRNADHQREIVDRAVSSGATPVDIGQRDVPWVVLVDPEGNEFCVLEHRDEYAANGPMAALVIDSVDPSAVAAFWSQVTGLPTTRSDSLVATVRRDEGFWLEFIAVTAVKQSANRLRLQLSSGVDEVARLEAAGATVLERRPGSVELADPEGNEFRLGR